MSNAPDILAALTGLLEARAIPYDSLNDHELQIGHQHGGAMRVRAGSEGELHITYRYSALQRRREDVELLASRILGLLDQQVT